MNSLKIIDNERFEAILGCEHPMGIIPISTAIFESQQFETKPVSGFEYQDGYPLCCPRHRALFQAGIDQLSAFPNCCEGHKNLGKRHWFRKSDYNYLPKKLVTTDLFTVHCINQSIDNPDWYKDITDYITYTASSFGQFPDGHGSPLGLSTYLKNLRGLINGKDIPKSKRNKIITFIDHFFEKRPNDETKSNIEFLCLTYQEWLNTFPFQLSIFQHLKAFFQNQLPFIKGKPEVNRYTGLASAKMISNQELIDILANSTEHILKEFNFLKEYHTGRLTDPQKEKLQLILANHKLTLNHFLKSRSNNPDEYVKILQEWFAREKEFLNEITPYAVEMDPGFFISSIILAIKTFQINDSKQPCINTIRNKLENPESAVQIDLKNFLIARLPKATVIDESPRGDGRIDLRISEPGKEDKIIEIKGWWNYDKRGVVNQIKSYLTDFENSGYIFMVNHCKGKKIADEYKNAVIDDATGYISNSWTEHSSDPSGYVYYSSRHKSGNKEKLIYHFIFNIYT